MKTINLKRLLNLKKKDVIDELFLSLTLRRIGLCLNTLNDKK